MIPFCPLVGAGQESRDVFEHHQWHVERVAGTHEAGRFRRGIVVEDAREEGRLVRDHTHAASRESTEAHHDVLRVVGLHLEEGIRVEDFRHRIPNVVRLLCTFGHQAVKLGTALVAATVGQAGGSSSQFCGRNAKTFLACSMTIASLGAEVGHARLAGMGARTPSSSDVTSSWVTVLTTLGPVTNM